MYIKLTGKQLLRAGSAIGHEKKKREKEMTYYMSISKNFIDYFDIIKMISRIRRTEIILSDLGYKNGLLLVGTQNTACFMSLARYGKKYHFSYICEKWKGGTLTNYKQIRKGILKYKILLQKKKFKKEFSFLDRKRLMTFYQIFKDKTYYKGLQLLSRPPDILFSGSVKKDEYFVKEGNILDIPIIGVVDTDTTPNMISYVIPGNDESVESIITILKSCLQYFLLGRRLRITSFYMKYKKKKSQLKLTLELGSKLNLIKTNTKYGRINNSRQNDRSRFSDNRISRSRSGNRNSVRIIDNSVFKKSKFGKTIV